MTIKTLHLALWFIFIFSFNLHSESYSIPDSLLRKMNSPVIAEKINGYISIINHFNKIMPDKALSYGENALQIARENNYPAGEGDVFQTLGMTYHNLSNYKKALNYFESAFNIRKKLNNNNGMGESLNRIALVYMVTGSYEKSLKYLYQSIDLVESVKNKKTLAEAYNLLGIINYILKDIRKAEEISLKALEISEGVNDKLVHAYSHENLTIIYIKTRDFRKALFNAQETLKLRTDMNDRVGIAGTLENIAIIYRDMRNYLTALDYYNKSLTLKKELNDKQGIASSYSGIGTVFIRMGEPESGLKHLIHAYALRKEIGDKRGMVSSLTRVAETYTTMGDYKKALEYYQLSVSYNDSLLNEQKNKAIAELQTEFQNQRKEQEILLLQRENTIQRNYRNYLLIISLLISAIAISAFIAYRSKRKVNKILSIHNTEVTHQKEELQRLNEELQKMNEDKDRFFTIIAHDLKSPFSALLGYSEFLAKDIKNLSEEEIGSFSEEIFNSSRKVFNLLENLLWWARLNTGKIEKGADYFKLAEVVEEVLSLFKVNADKKNIRFECEQESDTLVYANINMIHSVLRNLISNAIKFTYPDGIIRIRINRKAEMLQFSIEDNGMGMEEEYLENLFKEANIRSMNGTVKEAGTGLGLYLCKEFIEMNHGYIWAVSKLNSGSTFFFSLPTKKIQS